MSKIDLHFQVSLAVAEALTVRRPFTALRLSDGTPLSAPRTFNMPTPVADEVTAQIGIAMIEGRPVTLLYDWATGAAARDTFNHDLERSDIMCIEDLRRRKVNGRIKADLFRAKLRNLITRFPVRVQYFGDWHK